MGSINMGESTQTEIRSHILRLMDLNRSEQGVEKGATETEAFSIMLRLLGITLVDLNRIADAVERMEQSELGH